jgi:hypothetical protein
VATYTDDLLAIEPGAWGIAGDSRGKHDAAVMAAAMRRPDVGRGRDDRRWRSGF